MNRVQLGPAHKVLIDGFLAERTAYHLLIPKRPLTELMGQSSESALLDSGVSVRKSCQGKVYWEEDRVVGVRLDDDCLRRSDRVVVAVPWHAVTRTFGNAPNIFQEEVSQRTACMESAPITGIHTWWDTAWLPSPHAILMDRFCHWVFPDRNRPNELPRKVITIKSSSAARGTFPKGIRSRRSIRCNPI